MALVRESADLRRCDGIILPGGESTTIGKLLRSSGLWRVVSDAIREGAPTLGTCAGMVILASDLTKRARNDLDPMGVCDIVVERNAFGRQLESFETDLDVVGLVDPFRAVFIRAPVVASIGIGVEVLAWQNETAVMVRQGPVMACAFHPELTEDNRIHEMFLEAV